MSMEVTDTSSEAGLNFNTASPLINSLSFHSALASLPASFRLKENFLGCNIALPWKKLVYSSLDLVDPAAKRVETINTLIKEKDKLNGYNTDGRGIVDSITKYVNLKNKNVLMIGCGGGAQTVPYYLLKKGIKKLYLNDIKKNKASDLISKWNFIYKKKGKKIYSVKNEDFIRVFKEIDILINATPCGMFGIKEKSSFDLSYLSHLKKSCLLVEMIYNPSETPMLIYAKEKGHKICSGINMLVEQGAARFDHVFGFELTEKDKKFMYQSVMEGLSER